MHESKADLLASERQIEGFWDKVEKVPDGCWLWRGAIAADGYGVISLRMHGHVLSTGRAKQKAIRAHRFSWFLAHGAWPSEFTPEGSKGVLLHTCDVRACVNPEHLRLGSHAENSAEMVARGRSSRGARHYAVLEPHKLARGSQNARARLTEDQVLEIRKKFTGQRGQISALGREYGMPPSAIHLIVTNATWKHLPLCEPYKKHMGMKITNDLLRDRFNLYIGDLDANGCRSWRGPISSLGYPILCIGTQTFSAPRVAWGLANGSVPQGQTIRRTCGNKLCVASDHLETTREGDVCPGIKIKEA